MYLAQANALNDRYLETGFEEQFQQAKEWLKKALDAGEMQKPIQYYSMTDGHTVKWPLVYALPPKAVMDKDLAIMRLPMSMAEIELAHRLLPETVTRLLFSGSMAAIIHLKQLEGLMRLPTIDSVDIFSTSNGFHVVVAPDLQPFGNIKTFLSAPAFHLKTLARLFPNVEVIPNLKSEAEYANVFRDLRHIKQVRIIVVFISIIMTCF